MSAASLSVRTIVLAIIAAALAALSAAPNADAIRRETLKGHPGRMMAYFLFRGWGSSTGEASIRFGGAQFGVAPAYARKAQTVCETRRIFRFTGNYYERGWRLKFQNRTCTIVPPGHLPSFGAYDYPADTTGIYHGDLVVDWYIRRTGRLVAKARFDFNELSEYACGNSFCYTLYGFQDVAAMGFSYIPNG